MSIKCFGHHICPSIQTPWEINLLTANEKEQNICFVSNIYFNNPNMTIVWLHLHERHKCFDCNKLISYSFCNEPSQHHIFCSFYFNIIFFSKLWHVQKGESAPIPTHGSSVYLFNKKYIYFPLLWLPCTGILPPSIYLGWMLFYSRRPSQR